MKDSLKTPQGYTPELAAVVCRRIACGESVRTIGADKEMPCAASIFNWLNQYPDFVEQYTRAREQQVVVLAEEIIDISDDGSNDWMESNKRDNPGWVENGEAMARSRLRVDTRKWLLSKLAPKKYGEKLDVQHGGYIDVSDTALEARIAALAAALPDASGKVGDGGTGGLAGGAQPA